MRASPKEPALSADSLLTSYQVGELLQVNPSSVNKWVKDGRIPAFRTPGGHRRIRAADVVSFLSTHGMPVPASLTAASQLRLLIAEEDNDVRESLRRSLTPYEKSVQVTLVGNSVDALVQIGAMRPHAILLGSRLGQIDGFEVCRALKAAADTKSLRVVIVGNDHDKEPERRAGEAGAQSYMRRPLDVSQVLRELQLSK